jgi:hypothetical protein
MEQSGFRPDQQQAYQRAKRQAIALNSSGESKPSK